MRTALALGWIAIALLGFVMANWLNTTPDEPLARVGAGLYALLLTLTLILGVRTVLNRYGQSK